MDPAVDTPAEPEAAQKPASKKRRVPWGLFILLGFVLGGFGSCVFAIIGGLPKPVEERTVLELDLSRPVTETRSASALSLSSLGPGKPVLRDFVDALDRARSDEKVVGVVAQVGAGGHGFAVTQELRDAITRFRASGRFAIAWADSLGEGMPGHGGHLLASAFDEIWLQPSGRLALTGLSAETPFLRGALEKLGVEPEFSSRHEYKTYKNLYTETGFTEAHRESLGRLLSSWTEQLVAGIAQGRGMEPARAAELLGRGPYTAAEAKAAGLVDELGYRDEVLARVDEKAGGSARRLYPKVYLERAGRPHDEGTTVALIYGVGGVARRGGYDPLSGSSSMSAEDVSRAFRRAIDDDEVKAIVFRIDSPGGSYVASDTIGREVRRAKAAGKKVVATMGNVAGSGGYFVAMEADRIVAQPGTLTGSIGVVAGKFILRGLLDKLGVGMELLDVGENAGLWAISRGMDEGERARFEQGLDHIYADFVGKAAAARGMQPEELEPLARGRVWTGSDAHARKLIDDVGGLDVALKHARELLQLPETAPLKLVPFPKEREPLEALLASLGEGGRENSDDPGPSGEMRPGSLLRLARALYALDIKPRGAAAVVPPYVQLLGGL
jgi:protease-4